MPPWQPKHSQIWKIDGACIRLQTRRANHVWSYDFAEDRIHEARKYRMLNVLDEFTPECLAIRVDRKLKSTDVIDVLSDLLILRGCRSDKGSAFPRQGRSGLACGGWRQDGLHQAWQMATSRAWCPPAR